jgi:peroxiredoxin
MEKWKIAVIVLLLAAFGGFQAVQNRDTSTPDETSQQTPIPEPTLDPKFAHLIGKPVKPWKIPANLWMNTAKPLTPADLKGQVTLIEFFRIGCPHCEEAVPFLEQTLSEMAPRQLKMIGFQSPGYLEDPANPELDWKTVQKWVKSHGVKYPVAFDTNHQVKDQYGIEYYPMMLIVDRNGNVVHVQTGFDEAKAQQLTTALRKALR